jgi:hypothetical protein
MNQSQAPIKLTLHARAFVRNFIRRPDSFLGDHRTILSSFEPAQEMC